MALKLATINGELVLIGGKLFAVEDPPGDCCYCIVDAGAFVWVVFFPAAWEVTIGGVENLALPTCTECPGVDGMYEIPGPISNLCGSFEAFNMPCELPPFEFVMPGCLRLTLTINLTSVAEGDGSRTLKIQGDLKLTINNINCNYLDPFTTSNVYRADLDNIPAPGGLHCVDLREFSGALALFFAVDPSDGQCDITEATFFLEAA